jgi:hypothetical protein
VKQKGEVVRPSASPLDLQSVLGPKQMLSRIDLDTDRVGLNVIVEIRSETSIKRKRFLDESGCKEEENGEEEPLEMFHHLRPAPILTQLTPK